MKNKVKYITVLAAALMFACNEKHDDNEMNDSAAENHMEKAADHTEAAAEEAGDDWRRESESYRADVNARIERNDAEIERLKAEAKAQKKEARAEYEEEVAELKAKNDRLRARMRGYKEDSNDGWRRFKEEFNRDMDELGNAIENLGKDNKK